MLTHTHVKTYEFEIENDEGILPNLKYHVFVSKETTKDLGSYIKYERWGNDNGILYKYLDYTWRCQLIDGNVKLFYHNNEPKLVFHTGLKTKRDDDLYLLLIENLYNKTKKCVKQKWRVAFGNCYDGTDNVSFVTKDELNTKYGINDCDLPVKTDIFRDKTELIFDTSYKFKIDWQERLRTSKERIIKALKNDAGVTDITSTRVLRKLFEDEVKKSILYVQNNPHMAAPQAFIEQKKNHYGYHLELLIPLTLTINNKNIYFAMALRPHYTRKYYEGMSILTRKMAYANSRLVGPVTVPWLSPFVDTNIAVVKQDYNILNKPRNNIMYNNNNNSNGCNNYINPCNNILNDIISCNGSLSGSNASSHEFNTNNNNNACNNNGSNNLTNVAQITNSVINSYAQIRLPVWKDNKIITQTSPINNNRNNFGLNNNINRIISNNIYNNNNNIALPRVNNIQMPSPINNNRCNNITYNPTNLLFPPPFTKQNTCTSNAVPKTMNKNMDLYSLPNFLLNSIPNLDFTYNNNIKPNQFNLLQHK